MQPDAVALTASSARSDIALDQSRAINQSLRAGMNRRTVLVVVDEPHDCAVGIEPGPLAVAEAPGRALGADGADEAGGPLQRDADLFLVDNAGALDRLGDESDPVIAIGRQAEGDRAGLLLVESDERLGLGLVGIE